MKICINKKYKTRDGDEVIIYRTTADGSYPVHGSVIYSDGSESLESWNAKGYYYDLHDRDGQDLIEVVPRMNFRIWLNVYGDNVVMPFATLEAADMAASQVFGRMACIPVTVDCDVGEGIDDEDK